MLEARSKSCNGTFNSWNDSQDYNRIGTSDFFFVLDTGQLRAFLPQGVNTSFELECFLYHLDPASRVAKW